MKPNNSFLLLIALFFMSCFANAQGSLNGADRNIAPGQYKNRANKDQKGPDFVVTLTNNLTKQLDLNTFQSAAVKVAVEDYKNALISISSEAIPEEGKSEKIEREKDKMENKIIALLNKEQAEKFKEIKGNKGKKGKKKGKE